MKFDRSGRILIAIIGLSLLLRGLVYCYFVTTALPMFPLAATQSDMYANWEWSGQILAGDILGRETYHPQFSWMVNAGDKAVWASWWGDIHVFQQEPLYVYFLTFFRWVLPSECYAIPLLQLLFGGILLPLGVFLLGREIAGRRTGLYAAFIAVIFGPEIFYQCAVLRDWAVPVGTAFTLALAIRAVRQNRMGLLVLAGFMFGLGGLMKTTALLWLPVCACWLWFEGGASHSVIRWARGVVLLMLGALLGLLPLIVRNYAVGAPVFALSNRMPEGLIQGNAADTFPASLCHPNSQEALLKAAGGNSLKIVQGILGGYREIPGSFARVQGIKLLAAISPVDFTDNLSYEYGAERMPPLRLCPSWGLLLAFAIPGVLMLLFLRRGRSVWLGGLIFVDMVALLLPIALGRYRLEALPLLAIGAAQTLRFAVVQFRFRRWFGFILVIILTGLVYFLSYWMAGAQRFQKLAGPDEMNWIKLQRLHLPNRFVAMHVFYGGGQILRAADEAADFAERAAQYPFAGKYVTDAHYTEVRLLVQAAYQALKGNDENLAATIILRARGCVASIPVSERLTKDAMTAFLAVEIPLPAAQKFANLIQPASDTTQ